MFALFRTHHGFVILTAAVALVIAAVQSRDLNREVEKYNQTVQDPLRSFRFRHRAPAILLIVLACVLLASLILPAGTPAGYVTEEEYRRLSDRYDKLEEKNGALYQENDHYTIMIRGLSDDAFTVRSYFLQEENVPSFDKAKESMNIVYSTLYP